MLIKEIKNKKNWKEKQEFLQSYEYGDFLKKNKREILRLEDKNGEQIQGILSKTKVGKFAYFPRSEVKNINNFLDYFKKNNFIFIRVENTFILDINKKYKFFETKNRQPKNTWVLNIDKDIEKILEEMHKKTRYNIKLANKKGVIIEEKKDIDLFWKLNEVTTKRNNYSSHSKKYIEELLKLENVYQLNAYYNDIIIASAILLKHDDTFIYFFGASSNEYRNLMAPYLLHFEIIKLAKKLGLKKYDFWGIAPSIKEGVGKSSCYNNYCWQVEHPLNGVTRFKAGFSGYEVDYPQTIEITLKSLNYKMYKLLNKNKNIIGHPKSR